MRAVASLTALLLLGVCGCSSIPAGVAPYAFAHGESVELRVCVAPLTASLSSLENSKGYDVEEVLETPSLGREIARWLELNATFASVRLSEVKNAGAVLGEAWDEREDAILEITLRDMSTHFDGHNWLWLPNVANWIWWMIPAWFIATEEYSLEFEVDVVLRSVDSRLVLYAATIPVRAAGTFDEFDRGWQFFGFIYPMNDEDNWRMIASALLPQARSTLGETLARTLAKDLPRRLERPEVSGNMRKTLALTVGVSHYNDAIQHPSLPYADSDAQAVAKTLKRHSGLDDRHVTEVWGTAATRARVLEALAEIEGRSRDGDQLILYFAGYGTRRADGAPSLLLHEANGEGAGELSLAELAERLSKIPGQKLVVLDCGFGGEGRSITREGSGNPKAQSLDAFADTNATVFVATRDGGKLLAPQHLGASLFSYHFVEALSGRADVDHNGRISMAELFASTRDRTVVDSAYDGKHQQPVASGLERRFTLCVKPVEAKVAR